MQLLVFCWMSPICRLKAVMLLKWTVCSCSAWMHQSTLTLCCASQISTLTQFCFFTTCTFTSFQREILLLFSLLWTKSKSKHLFLSLLLPGCSIPRRHYGERRHTDHHTTQTRRDPKNVSGDVRVGKVGLSVSPWPPHTPVGYCACLNVHVWVYCSVLCLTHWS